jgi:ABC-type multidrug transport system ATPase subunit/ABC-type multidrug transport system permease subunit
MPASPVILRSFKFNIDDDDDGFHDHDESTFSTLSELSTRTTPSEASTEGTTAGGCSLGKRSNEKELQLHFDTSIISKEDFQFGVEAIDVHHWYSSSDEPILRGLTMRVEPGSIYGLLGASGCGKTTLLKCMIGMTVPRYGYMDVFGRKPRDPDSGIPGKLVGYMPQDVALYNDLTIQETLVYFGRLYFMPWAKMMIQIDYLIDMLDLPDKGRLISTLSGGQMRRVSFAAALIHEPPLVILDEPTAGVDPILRSNIWKYLVNISRNSHVTVIITTHYIEEARSADRVGLMRHGRLLAEDSPQNLLTIFNLPSLEDVFLALCTKIQSRHRRHSDHYDEDEDDDMRRRTIRPEERSEGTEVNNNIIMTTSRMGKAGGCNHLNEKEDCGASSSTSRMQRKGLDQVLRSGRFRQKSRKQRITRWWSDWWSMFMTLMWKNYIRSIRHPILIVFQYVLPVIQITLFGICIGGDPFDIRLGIVNDEPPPAHLSNLFIQHLDPFFVRVQNCSSEDEARVLVQRSELWGYLHFSADFTDSLTARMDAHNRGDPNDSTINSSKILIHADLTDRLVSLTIQRSLDQSFQQFMRSALIEFGAKEEIATLPIVPVDPPIYGSLKHPDHKGSREYMAPGVILTIAFSMAYAVTCLVLILEREEKTFERNFVTGITSSQIIIAHTLTRMMFMIAQSFLILFLTVHAFNIPTKGPIAAAILLLMSQNLAGIAYGMLLSAMFTRTHEAAVVAIGTVFFMFFLSGVLWPVEAIGLWLRWFAYMQPCTIPNATLRRILSHGIGFTDLAYWKGIGVSITWAFILFMISIWNYSYT